MSAAAATKVSTPWEPAAAKRRWPACGFAPAPASSRSTTATWPQFFTIDQDQNTVLAPLEHCGVKDSVDVSIQVHGGGNTGQAGACMQGIARALLRLRQRPHGKAPREELPHPRRADEGTQEARSPRRPPWHAVLEALIELRIASSLVTAPFCAVAPSEFAIARFVLRT